MGQAGLQVTSENPKQKLEDHRFEFLTNQTWEFLTNHRWTLV